MEWLDERRRADVVEGADLAFRALRIADLASVLDEQMRKHRPLLARKERNQILLDLHGVGVLREAESVTDGERQIARFLQRVAWDTARKRY